MKMDFNADTVAGISAYVGELVAAIQQGQQISEEDLTNLQNIVTFLNGLDVTGTGQHIKEGVAQGMTEAGWSRMRKPLPPTSKLRSTALSASNRPLRA